MSPPMVKPITSASLTRRWLVSPAGAPIGEADDQDASERRHDLSTREVETIDDNAEQLMAAE